MRQLFLPACLCLVTWSGATNSDSRLTLDEFTGSLSAKKISATRVAARENRSFDAAQSDTPPKISGNIAISDTLSDDTAGDWPKLDTAALKPSFVPTPTETIPQAAPTAEEIAAVISGLAIEPPVPSGVVVNNGIPIGIPLPPIPKPVIARTEEEICSTLTEAAQRNDVPAPFFIRLLFQESRFNPAVVSPVGAQGIAQFMPETANSMGVDNPFDPLQAIPASARLLRSLISQFGNLGLAAAAYNAGPKRITDWLAAKGKSKLPEETQGYVKTITGKPVETWSAAQARHPSQKLPQRAPCQEAAGLLAYNGPDAVPLPAAAPVRATAIAAAKAEKIKAAASKIAAAKAAEHKPVVTAEAKIDAKPATKSEAHADAKPDIKIARGVTITHRGARVIAVIPVAQSDKKPAHNKPNDDKPTKDAEAKKPAIHTAARKASTKTAAQQLAARKHDQKPKREKIAQR